jgi:hypothetical protein
MLKHGALVLGILVAALAMAAPAGAASGATASGCLARHLPYVENVFEATYRPGCTGHDEPELLPISHRPHSARDLTWKAVLPVDGVFPVAATGPAFWFGGTVRDPHSLFGQSFFELQFYPDSVVRHCAPNGNYSLRHVPNAYSVCAPTWAIVGQREPAHFNGELFRHGTHRPLVMHGGDTVTVHYFTTRARDGAHVTVRDLTTHQAGTIVLHSPRFGPLMPAFDVQRVGNTLGWGAVHDTPNSFVWEIGHTAPFGRNPAAFCTPGQRICQSYNAPAWAGTSPIRIESVRFGRHARAHRWAVVSDYGGAAEVTDPKLSTCSSYGGRFCIYPWYTRNHDGSFSFGVDYPTTANDYGKVRQYASIPRCGGPFGPRTTYCVTRIH